MVLHGLKRIFQNRLRNLLRAKGLTSSALKQFIQERLNSQMHSQYQEAIAIKHTTDRLKL